MMKKLLLALVAIICSANAAMAETDITGVNNTLYFEKTTVEAGKTATISVKMKDNGEVQSIGYKFKLPEGLAVVKSARGILQISLSMERTDNDSHSCSKNYITDLDEYRVGILQTAGFPFMETDGEVCTIKIEAAADMKPGSYDVTFYEVELSGKSGIITEKGVNDTFTGTITVTGSTGINDAKADADEGVKAVYSANGMKQQQVRKGLNIIRKADGTVVKVAK